MEALLRLLKGSNQDGAEPCWIITVVTRIAASAAADLLSSGDYAIAFPDCNVHYHGLRTFNETLTVESSSIWNQLLRSANDLYARELAKKIEFRFFFRYVTLRNDFAEHRAQNGKDLSDIDCFIELVMTKLSEKARKAFVRARDRWHRYEALLARAAKASNRSMEPERPATREARYLKAIVDFELSSNKNNARWTFRDGGLARLAEDFFLLNEYLDATRDQRFLLWCRSLGRSMLSKDQQDAVMHIDDERAKNEKMVELVRPIMKPLWSFFMALCHALQEGGKTS